MEQRLPYYELTGRGPYLALLESGFSDANGSAAAASALQDSFTVVRVDRRGLSRSTGISPDGTITAHARDVLAVLDYVAPGQHAAVFGTSIGALVAISLAETAPDRFHFVGIHEPPLEALVDWQARAAELDKVEQLASVDPLAAIQTMGRVVRSGDVREEAAPVPATAGDIESNIRTFLASDFGAVRRFRPQLDLLRGSASRLRVSGGEYSRGRFEYESARQLARLASLPFDEIAVGHSALTDFPETTAAYLRVRAAPRTN